MLPPRFGHSQTIVDLDMFCCGSHLPSLKLTFSHRFKGMLGKLSRFLLGSGLFSGGIGQPEELPKKSMEMDHHAKNIGTSGNRKMLIALWVLEDASMLGFLDFPIYPLKNLA